MTATGCDAARGMLPAHLDGDLPPAFEAAVREHLAGCAACRGELELLRATLDALRTLPDLPAPAGLLAGVRAGIAAPPRRAGFLHRIGRGWLVGVPIGALASLVLVLGIAFLQDRHPELARQAAAPPAVVSPAPEAVRSPEPAAPAPAPGRTAETKAETKDDAPRGDRQRTELGRPPAESDRPTAVAAVPGTPREPSTGVPRLPAPPVAVAVAVAEAPAPAAPPAAPLPAAAPAAMAEAAAPSPAAVDAGKKEAAAGEPAAAPSRFVVPEQEHAPEGRGALKAKSPGSRLPVVRDAVEALGGADARLAGNEPDAGRVDASGAVVIGGSRGQAAGLRAAAGEERTEGTPREAIEVLYVLTRDGEDLEELRRIIRREGGSLLEVRALDPERRREAAAPVIGSVPAARRITRGWTIEAKVPRRNLSRFLDAVRAGRGYEIIRREPAGDGAARDAEQSIRINLFR